MGDRGWLIQPSFAAGELAPSVQGRVDLAKYRVGAAEMTNFFSLHYGGAATRAGTQAIMRSKQQYASNPRPRLIPFIYSTVQAYVLEFGDQWMRVLMNGGYVLEPAKLVNSISNTDPATFNVTAHGYVFGDWLWVTGALGMTQANTSPGKVWIVNNVPTADTFQVVDLDGVPFNAAALPAFLGGAIVARVFTLPTPYLAADLALLKYVQNADTLTITHPSYAPADLTRTAHYVWTLTTTTFAAEVQPPLFVGAASVNDPLQTSVSISAITNANPGVITTALAHGFNVNDPVYIYGCLGMTQINSSGGRLYKVRAVGSPTTFTLNDLNSGGGNQIDTTSYGVYTTGGLVGRYFGAVDPQQLVYDYVVTSVVDSPFEESVASGVGECFNAALNQDSGVGNQVTWAAPATGPAPNRYYIYRSNPTHYGITPTQTFGYIGQSETTSFLDSNIAPDFTRSPPLATNPFAGGVNPSCATYFDARRVYAAPTSQPQTIYGTVIGNYNNMDVRSPVQEDDAFTFELASRQVNAIKHMVPSERLLAFTSGGVWAIRPGSNSDTITPLSINAKPQTFNGTADQPAPLSINADLLYVQARGGKVRDIAYNFYNNIFSGNDVSVLSSHFFYGYTITDWCYCEEPFYQVLACRNDGAMLCFTYLKEQDVYAWSRYVSLGVSGTDRIVSCASIPEANEDVCYVTVARTIPGAGYGNELYFTERFSSRNFLVNGVADVRLAWCLDSALRYDGVSTTSITGLDHLNGASVMCLADGSVQGPFTVAGGAITLTNAASFVLTGLAYECALQMLPIDTGEPTTQGKRKKISSLSVLVENTRGLEYATMNKNVDDTYSPGTYAQFAERTTEAMGSPVPLFTGMRQGVAYSSWAARGAVRFRQTNPLPATVLAVIPVVTLGDDN